MTLRRRLERHRDTPAANTSSPQPDFGCDGWITSSLPGAVLTKSRHSIPPMGVDSFGGELLGLILAEAELREDQCRAFNPPDFVIAEVTHDLRFTGGQLAATDAAAVRQALRSFGL